ncbi:ribosomal protein S1 [Flavobacterium sp. 103]|nr:ribosomal protein S1 [Flavobacterium sp. 103]
MSSDKIFSAVLNRHDPKAIISHGILRFFAEDLSENEKIEFVKSIFDKGSWILSTEIASISDSEEIKTYTQGKFFQIFNNWVSKRIEHSAYLSKISKNAFLPYMYKMEFKEALFSIKNLNFPLEIMSVLERFINHCNSALLKNYLDDALWVVIEKFEVDEIEIFFSYFLKRYDKDSSDNIRDFIYHFINRLAYSHIIFNLSNVFINQLGNLSKNFIEDNYQNNYQHLISILLLEYIEKKELDLSNSKFDDLIEEYINNLEKGNPYSVDFFRLLESFNYSFKSYDYKLEVKILFDTIETNLFLVNCSDINQIKLIFIHYIKSSEKYFELLLFYIEQSPPELIKDYLINYTKLIDKLRLSFNSLLWFDEYSNFNIIKGKIDSVIPGGFNVKLDENIFNRKIEEKQLETFCTKEFISQYSFGFLKTESLKEFYRSSIFYNFLENKTTKKNNQDIIEIARESESESFFISNVNYSTTNKGSIITLVPFNKPLNDKIIRFELKNFFSSIELFLIEKAYEYLNLESPFHKRTTLTNKLFPFKYNNDRKISLSEETFWIILEELRPNLYEAIYLKHKKEENSFNELLDAYENGKTISGLVKSRTKGGMFVEILGLEAFLPGSQMDIKPIIDFDFYIGKTMEFRIVKVFPENKNFVVSHRVLIEEDFEIKKKDIITKLQNGIVLEGIVKNITSYGVFIDLGGFDGLIHITDLSWDRINHPSEVLEIDQVLNVVILDIDIDKSRIQLGLKQLKDHPWNNLDTNLKIGDIVKGKVVEMADYGAFIEVAEGVEGLIHISEMTWKYIPSTNKERKLYVQKLFTIGDKVEAIILTLDREVHKMSLGIKQLSQDPWSDIPTKYPIGSRHSGIVRNFTNFGVFVKLDEYIDGLIYITDLSWTKKIKHPSEFVNVGEKLDVVVLELDVDRRKLSLGHKQTTANPWDQYEDSFAVGTIHTAEISEIVDKGATVELSEDIVAFIPTRHLEKEDGKKLKKGDSADFKVIEFNKEFKRVVASHTAIFYKEIDGKINPSNKTATDLPTNTPVSIVRGDNDTYSCLKVGDIIKGKVIEIADYGAYIEVIDGIEGLIRVSEMSWNSFLCLAQDFIKIDDVVEVIIIFYDKHIGKMELSIKQLTEDPWQNITNNLPIGSKHTGKVVSFTNFGLYVELNKNIVGYIANTNLSWTKNFKHPSEFINLGDKIDVIILQINAEERKLSLGHKQTKTNR